jgi:hypothetical protein
MIDVKKYTFENDFDPSEIIKSTRLYPGKPIKRAETLLAVNEYGINKPLCTRGSFSLIIGKAKSRKTFLTTMLGSAVINRNLFDMFIGNPFYSICIFDTEQSDYYANKAYERYIRLCNGQHNKIDYLPIKPYSPVQRQDIINRYLEINSPDFVLIDGIRDLVSCINSEEQATEMITQLYKWLEFKDCHIMNVLHMNKADMNARGHLGTELVNKAETVLSVSKDKHSNFSSVEVEYMRGIEIDSFQFEIDDNLPVPCAKSIIERENKKAPF